MREKLIELLADNQRGGHGYFGSIIENGVIADHLIAHGVTVQGMCNNVTERNTVDEFVCSECGCVCRDAGRYVYDEDAEDWNCYEFEFRYCPNCGKRVQPEPPKGE